jgi:hypothetical protein
MISRLKFLSIIALFMLSVLTGAPPIAAAAEFSEEKIEAFVNAAIDVAIINTAAKHAFDKATNSQIKNSIISAARLEMDASIAEAPGITLEGRSNPSPEPQRPRTRKIQTP